MVLAGLDELLGGDDKILRDTGDNLVVVIGIYTGLVSYKTRALLLDCFCC